MSSDEEFSVTNSEDYFSDDTESIDFQEIETEERQIVESRQETMPQHYTASDDGDTTEECFAYSDEPLANAKWLKNYKEQQEEKRKQEEELKKRLPGERKAGEW